MKRSQHISVECPCLKHASSQETRRGLDPGGVLDLNLYGDVPKKKILSPCSRTPNVEIKVRQALHGVNQ